jgi:hypothetical protein
MYWTIECSAADSCSYWGNFIIVTCTKVWANGIDYSIYDIASRKLSIIKSSEKKSKSGSSIDD